MPIHGRPRHLPVACPYLVGQTTLRNLLRRRYPINRTVIPGIDQAHLVGDGSKKKDELGTKVKIAFLYAQDRILLPAGELG